LIRRISLAAAIALATVATTAPSALATYQGRNGTLAYQVDTHDPNSGNTVDSDISSIPSSSKANCEDLTGNGAPCAIGRFSYSPHGTRIVAERSGQLEVLDANGTNVTVLKQLTSSDTEPAFLPNGATIVFAGTVNGHPNLYTVRSDGTDLKQLTTNGGAWPAPCGNGSIAFVNNGALYLRHGNGGVRRLAKRGVLTADCAPNSRSIVYATVVHVFIVKTTGGKPRRLKGADDAKFPGFSPNGSRIASLQSLPDPEAGGYSVDTIVVQEAKNGRRVRKDAIGDNLGVITGGPLAWQPKP
jgi:Tol biopolymer transport system component